MTTNNEEEEEQYYVSPGVLSPREYLMILFASKGDYDKVESLKDPSLTFLDNPRKPIDSEEFKVIMNAIKIDPKLPVKDDTERDHFVNYVSWLISKEK